MTRACTPHTGPAAAAFVIPKITNDQITNDHHTTHSRSHLLLRQILHSLHSDSFSVNSFIDLHATTLSAKANCEHLRRRAGRTFNPAVTHLLVKREPHGFLARNSEVFWNNLPAPVAPQSDSGRGTDWIAPVLNERGGAHWSGPADDSAVCRTYLPAL